MLAIAPAVAIPPAILGTLPRVTLLIALLLLSRPLTRLAARATTITSSLPPGPSTVSAVFLALTSMLLSRSSSSTVKEIEEITVDLSSMDIY